MTVAYKARRYNEDTDSKGFEVPEIDDGMYEAKIVEVTDKDFPQPDGSTVAKYMVDWEIADLYTAKAELVKLRQFVKIPRSLIEDGYVHPMSNMYPFLKAIGIDPDQEDYEITPTDWVGTKARIVVKNVKIEKGKNAGSVRPQITDVMPPAKSRPATRPAAEKKEDEDY